MKKAKYQHGVEVFTIETVPVTTRTHLRVEAAGCVEIHAGVESACACNAAVIVMFHKEHHLGH